MRKEQFGFGHTIIKGIMGVLAIISLASCGGGGGGGKSDSRNAASNEQFTVQVIVDGEGSVTPNTQVISSGNQTTITLTPNAGHEVFSASGCGGSMQGDTFKTGPISSNCQVNVLFRPKLVELETLPTIDPQFSNDSTLRITQFASLIDQTTPGSTLRYIAYEVGISIPIVLALDNANNILLVGFANGGITEITAESTAQFLVHMMLGGRSSETDQLALFNVIKETEGFSDLVQNVADSFEIGTPLYQNQDIISALEDVLSQIQPPTGNSVESVGTLSKILPLPRGNGSLPMEIVAKSLLGLDKGVKLSAASSSAVSLSNKGDIFRSVRLYDSDGQQHGGIKGEYMLRPDSTLEINKQYRGAFSITTDMNIQAQASNIVNMSFGLLKIAAGQFGNGYSSNECLNTAVSLVIDTDLEALNRAYTRTDFSLIDSIGFFGAAELVSACGSKVLSQVRSNVVASLIKLASPIATASRVYAAGQFGLQLLQYKEALDLGSRSIGVCVDETETPMSCVSQLKVKYGNYVSDLFVEGDFTAQSIVMVPGALAPLQIEAYDINGALTALPYGLEEKFINDTGSAAFNILTKELRALRPEGRETLEIRDPATNTKLHLIVGIADLQISPSKLELFVNGASEIITLSADNSGNKVVTNGTTIRLRFAPGNPTDLLEPLTNLLNSIWSSFNDLQSFPVRGVKVGETSAYLEISSSLGTFASNIIDISVKTEEVWHGNYTVDICNNAYCYNYQGLISYYPSRSVNNWRITWSGYTIALFRWFVTVPNLSEVSEFTVPGFQNYGSYYYGDYGDRGDFSEVTEIQFFVQNRTPTSMNGYYELRPLQEVCTIVQRETGPGCSYSLGRGYIHGVWSITKGFGEWDYESVTNNGRFYGCETLNGGYHGMLDLTWPLDLTYGTFDDCYFEW